jgi:ABC-2 type transport system permease protein
MFKISAIANREYRAMVRTKAFLITVILMPILMCGAIVVQRVLQGRVNIDDKTLVLVDWSERCFDGTVALAEARNSTLVNPSTGRQRGSRYIVKSLQDMGLDQSTDIEAVRLTLSDLVRARDIFAFAEIFPRAIRNDDSAADAAPIEFRSESAVARSMRRWLSGAVNEVIRNERLRDAGVNPSVVREASVPVDVADRGLFSQEGDSVVQDEATSRELAIMVPVILMMLMFMSIMVSSQPLLQSVVEEKQQRIAEVLLGSATPYQLMMGKLLGNVAVALTLVGLYLTGGYGLARFMDVHHIIPIHMFGWFIVYQALAVFLYGSLFIAIGAACSDLKDAQSFIMPVMVLLVMPMMVWFNVLRDPLSTFSTWLSFFPPATPMLMVLRLATTTALPWWQPLLGIILVLVTAMATVSAAGRIFRVGILSQGKTPKLRELCRWMLHG